MSSEAQERSGEVFVRPHSASTGGMLLLVAGVGGLCFAAMGFALAIFSRVGTMALHTMTTFPAILSLGALTAGWTLLRTPLRVAVGDEGLTIETRRGSRFLRWDEVGCATVESGGTSHRKRLNITDTHGKSIVMLDQSFERFDGMVALISRHVEAKGDDTALRILRKKARRNGAIATAVGAGLLLAAVFIALETRREQRAARLLDEKGQPGEGEIVRRFVAPNGVTKRVEYRVGGSSKHNVEVEPDYWNQLAGARTIPVIYVPDEPDISRPATGEVRDEDFTKTPAGGYGLSALGGLIALFLLASGPFVWNGWDLALDNQTRKWSLKRYGKAVWTSR